MGGGGEIEGLYEEIKRGSVDPAEYDVKTENEL
jgi:hypothetical protein